jgi:hypothetical protein
MQTTTIFAICGFLAFGCGGAVDSGPSDSSSNQEVGAHSTEGGGEPAHPADEAGTDAGVDAACSVVLAANYDQSCTVDSDCVGVGEVPSCPATACDSCEGSAINREAMVRYQAAFVQAIASVVGQFCGCRFGGGAICRTGYCKLGGGAPDYADTLPACVDAGGQCAYITDTICGGGLGPPDACAYSDESCCLN